MITATANDVLVEAGGLELPGTLSVPPDAIGVVAFAHGSGSSRLSPRNTAVARTLQGRGLGTLLFDLLTPTEDAVYQTRFDIPLLSRRLEGAVVWLGGQAETSRLPVGLFGASTGAAAALVAAARLGGEVSAVVSRGGRPDLAGAALPEVTAPTLLIVGGLDDVVIGMNRDARARMTAETQLAIVPGATHLFEEPGTLEQVAELAGDWFERHLGEATARSR